MPTVTLDAISNGDAADATPVNNNFQELQTAINALDDANWDSGLIFPISQLTQGSATSGQALVWSGSAWAPSSIGLSALAQGGATTGQFLAWSGSAWAPASPGTLLGSVSYNPTTVTTATTSSATGADIDAANLSLAITLPGTKMLVVFNFVTDDPGDQDETMFGVRESTTDVAYAKLVNTQDTGTARQSVWLLVTGLTAGAHTYKAAFRSANGVTATGAKYGTQASPASTDPGPFVMSIFSVP